MGTPPAVSKAPTRHSPCVRELVTLGQPTHPSTVVQVKGRGESEDPHKSDSSTRYVNFNVTMSRESRLAHSTYTNTCNVIRQTIGIGIPSTPTAHTGLVSWDRFCHSDFVSDTGRSVPHREFLLP